MTVVVLVGGAWRHTKNSSAPARVTADCKSLELSMDVDGDGRPDRVCFERVDRDVWANVYLQSNNHWTLRSTSRLGEWRDGQKIEAIDADGDGKMDLIRRWNDNGVNVEQLFISDGEAFEPRGQRALAARRCLYAC